ncbi:MAG: hypothetical protein DDT34_02540 [Firmicutes bacterium]|nr:hypothetical protein [Bacillota bacterium]
MLLATFEDDFLDEETRDRHVYGANGNQAAGPLAVETGEAIRLLGTVGAQDKVEEGALACLQLLLPLLFA